MKKLRPYLLLLLFLLPGAAALAKTTEYEIDIRYETVNFTGKDVTAMTIGGTIPGQLIEATEGDTLRVTFHNKMDVDTSIHWHGILLPNDQDGVPYLTTPPIRAHSSFTYEYPVIQSGTYWYHSHTGLQEQRGVYGALVFHPREKAYAYESEQVVVFSDWTDENPDAVLRHLKSDGDYYSFKKGTVQSWLKVFQHGWKAVKIRVKSALHRMGPMDLSDVGYDAFLVNGQNGGKLADARKGDKVLLRLINASASTYFDVEFAGGNMQVVAADGLDVVPFETGTIRMAIAETYDVIVTLPEEKSYELRATAVDGSGYGSAYLGGGEAVPARDMPKPDLFLMDHFSGKKDMDHSHHRHDMGFNYDLLRSKTSTALPGGNPVREVVLRLTGNMERYIWSFNDKVLEEEDRILIRRGENVRFILKNETMMSHPIHLHGHFFRVLNAQGEYSPLKHTVDVKPMDTTVIEFLADKEKNWFFHCHILYHMMSGMARIVSYEEDLNGVNRHAKHGHGSHWFGYGNIAAQSNMTEGFLRYAGIRNQFEVKWDNNYTGEYDVEPYYLRNITRFLDVFAGGEFDRNDKDETENVATFGFRYVLPLLVNFEYRVDHRGSMQLGFDTHLQLTERISAGGFYELKFHHDGVWDYSDTDIEHEYRAEIEYRLTRNFSLIGNYDSDHRGGGGVRLRF